MESDRYKRGWETLKQIDRHAGERLVEELKFAIFQAVIILPFITGYLIKNR